MIEGRVTSYDPSSRTGQINDADENEYRFSMTDWTGRGKPAPGTLVRFEPMSGKAYKIEVTGKSAETSEQGRNGRIAAWISIVVGVFFLLAMAGLMEESRQITDRRAALEMSHSCTGILFFITLNLMLATAAVARGTRGRVVGWVSLVMNGFLWLLYAGLVIGMAQVAAGIEL